MLKINLHLSASLRQAGFGLAFLLCSIFPICTVHASSLPQTIQIDAGAVSGVPGSNTADVMAFKGIPFASPPVGDLRWKPPVAPAKWTSVLKSDHLAPSCMQIIRDGTVPGGKSPNLKAPYDSHEFMAHGQISEDCLYLNVWTPAKAARDNLPVMVWIYGGAFNEGSASIPAYDGERLASHGAVVVTINYRLGVFGFLALPELSKESPHHVSGNYGLLDQVAALQWVKRNIAAFGGDPTRVTIFGQSAGSGSTHFLSISPLAKGLFQRSIAESGAHFFSDPSLPASPMSYRTLSKAEADYLKWARSAGAETLKQLRAMSEEQLNKAGDVPRDVAPFFRPTLDGWVMPASYSDAYAKGMEADVPVIVGSNADEAGAVPHPSITVAEYKDWAHQQFGPMADEFLTLYPAKTNEEAGQAKNTAARDIKRASIYLWALSRKTTKPTYLYFWNHPLPGPMQEEFGAFHISEVPYVFSSLAKADRPFTKKDWEIAAMMSAYWVNFAANGNPNGQGLPTWPALKPGVKVTMQLGDNTGPIPIESEEKRFDFIQRFFASQQKW